MSGQDGDERRFIRTAARGPAGVGEAEQGLNRLHLVLRGGVLLLLRARGTEAARGGAEAGGTEAGRGGARPTVHHQATEAGGVGFIARTRACISCTHRFGCCRCCC